MNRNSIGYLKRNNGTQIIIIFISVILKFYKQAKKLKIQPHEIDALMIGLYFLSTDGKYFRNLSKARARQKMQERVVFIHKRIRVSIFRQNFAIRSQ
jgi:hypothetical protein